MDRFGTAPRSGVPMPGRLFCSKCGLVVRSPNHVCQPVALKRFKAQQAFVEAQKPKNK